MWGRTGTGPQGGALQATPGAWPTLGATLQQQGRPRPRCPGGRALAPRQTGRGCLFSDPQQGQHSREPFPGCTSIPPEAPRPAEPVCRPSGTPQSKRETEAHGQAQSDQEAAMRDAKMGRELVRSCVSSRRGKGSGQLAVLELETRTRTAPSPPPAGLGTWGHTGACSPLLAHRQCGQGPRLPPELTTARLRPRHGHGWHPRTVGSAPGQRPRLLCWVTHTP